MRTIVYVDGYNLYYGRITGTPYKWLDIPVLFQDILKVQDPSTVLEHVKYFSAPALANFSRRGADSANAQTDYHRALETKHPSTFSKILGKHSFTHDYAPLVVEGQKPDKDNRVLVWKVVEKKTDVNLAMAMYRDAAKGALDQLVLCSNDSDAEPALEAIRNDFPNLRIGIVTPRRPPSSDGERVISTSLSSWADWTRSHITDEELEKAQLPTNVRSTTGKIFKKPMHWYPE